jgi:hypothetical protein
MDLHGIPPQVFTIDGVYVELSVVTVKYAVHN